MTPEALQAGALDLARRVYTETERTARRHRFHDQRRRHLRAARAAQKALVTA
jgi:hypothetical protein